MCCFVRSRGRSPTCRCAADARLPSERPSSRPGRLARQGSLQTIAVEAFLRAGCRGRKLSRRRTATGHARPQPARTSAKYFFSAGVPGRGRDGNVASIDAPAALRGRLRQPLKLNLNAASCCAGVSLLKMKKLPPPVGRSRVSCRPGTSPRRSRTWRYCEYFIRLPVVVQIMTFFSMKSFGVVPHSTIPDGCTPCFFDRSTQYCSASNHLRIIELCLRAGFVGWDHVVLRRQARNSQYGKPLEVICTPYCVTLPLASFLVSFCAMLVISAPGLRRLVQVQPLEQFLVPVKHDGRKRWKRHRPRSCRRSGR